MTKFAFGGRGGTGLGCSAGNGISSDCRFTINALPLTSLSANRAKATANMAYVDVDIIKRYHNI